MARPRQISDDDILATVRAAVLEEGPAVSLDRVADRLGVTAPALFKRFGSKNALLLAALSPPRPPFLDALERPPDDRPFAEQLTALFHDMGAWYRGSVPCMVALKNSGISFEEIHEALGEAPPVVIARTLARWLKAAHERRLVRVPEPETTAVAMLGALQARAFISHLTRRNAPPRELDRDAAGFTTLFLEGIAPLPRPATTRRPTARRPRTRA